jgi:hypothetical protein
MLYTVVYLPARLVVIYPPLTELLYQDSTLFRFVIGQVNSSLWRTSSPYYPIQQIFRALVPNSLIESEHRVIPQALAYLMFLLRLPRDSIFSDTEQEIIRIAQFGFLLDVEFASEFLCCFCFRNNPENIEYINRLVNKDSYIGNPYTQILKGL